jgi:hypothetical protein
MARIRIDGTNGNDPLLASRPLVDTYKMHGLGAPASRQRASSVMVMLLS